MVDRERARHSSEPIYNIKAVVQRTGIPADTVRAWERRYGMPRPQRTETGRRLYSERDIAAIRWLRERTAAGMTISQAIHQFQSLGEAPLAEISPGREAGPRAPEALADDLLQALLAFDEARAGVVAGEAFALYSVEEVCLRVFSPVLVQLGDRWHRGEATVAQEHFAANFVRRRLAAMLEAYTPAVGRGLIVGACGPDEEHEIGLLMLCLFLARRTWRVVYLGANVPVADLLETVARLKPEAVCLSASSARTAPALATTARALAQQTPRTTLLAVGGRAFNDDPALREQIDGHFIGADASEGVARIEQLLA